MRTSSRVSIVRVVATLVALAALAWALLAWRGSDAADPAELTRAAERRENGGATAAPVGDPASSLRDRVAAFVSRCREAASADIRPGKVVSFDGGLAPSAVVPYVTPRVDGLPVIRVASRTNSDVAEPLATPTAGHFGVSGEVVYTTLMSDQPSSRHYFCEIVASPTSIDVKKVSIEIVR